MGGRPAEPDRVPAQRGRRPLRSGQRRGLAGAGSRARSWSPPGCRCCARARRSGCWELRHDALQPLRMGDPAPVPGGLLHARPRGRGRRVLPQARAERGSGLHDQDHGGAGHVARGHGRRHAPAGHRPPRAQAPGDAEPRLPEELHERGPGHDLRQPEGLDARGPGAGHLVPGAQEGGRHPPHAAAGHLGPVLQRRVRRHLRHRLRLHRRRVHPPGAAGPRGRGPQAAPRSCRTSPRSTSSARRTSASTSSSRPRGWRASGSTAPRWSPPCRPRTPSRPRAWCRPADEKILIRVSGDFRSEQDILAVNFVAERPDDPPGRHRARDARPRRSRRSRCSASTGRTPSGSPSRCARAATSWRSGATSSRPWRRSSRTCRSGSRRRSSPTSP